MDPIADMLASISNALRTHHKEISTPYSKIKFEIIRILLEEGYINNFMVEEENSHRKIIIQLKYTDEKKPAIQNLKRISKQSRRVYVDVRNIPYVLNGLGIAVLSTPQGVITDREAREKRIGGEVLCYVY